jgi:hypothetical protein
MDSIFFMVLCRPLWGAAFLNLGCFSAQLQGLKPAPSLKPMIGAARPSLKILAAQRYIFSVNSPRSSASAPNGRSWGELGGFVDVVAGNLLAAAQVGDGAGDLQDAVVAIHGRVTPHGTYRFVLLW